MDKARMFTIAVALIVLTPGVSAAVRTKDVEYRQGETVLQGFFA